MDQGERIGADVADDGFTAFFRGAYPGIVGQLRLLTGDLASAEDVAQEAFTRAASRWSQLSRYGLQPPRSGPLPQGRRSRRGWPFGP